MASRDKRINSSKGVGSRRRLSALGLRRDPHGSVKQIHHEELEDGDKERPSAFSKIMLKQTDSGIQQLHGAGERTQDQQLRRRLLVDRPQCEQSQRNCARRRVLDADIHLERVRGAVVMHQRERER